VPIMKNGQVVGGIGVFFPGTTGFATEENSKLSITFDPNKVDRSLEAEVIAFAAVGGAPNFNAGVGTLNGVPLPDGLGLTFARIGLVGIPLELFGPGGTQGPEALLGIGRQQFGLGTGSPNSGSNVAVDPGANGVPDFAANGLPGAGDDVLL